MQTVIEKKASVLSGFVVFGALVAALPLEFMVLRGVIREFEGLFLLGLIATIFLDLLVLIGLFIVHPNEARVAVRFGKYVGSVREPGFWWMNPFTTKKSVSLRIRNFNSQMIKVNDLDGNPIEIAAVVVWHVVDSARALFDVDNYEQFVAIQSETAIRSLATEYPYDTHNDAHPSLRGKPQEIADALRQQVHTRLETAGVEVIESRLSHLAYAPEIAQAMLRRQQAQAIIAARTKIVEGAVGMVDMALKALSEQHIVTLDEDKKATMVNNLLVTLVAESEMHPVINTGTLYQ